MQGNNRAHGRSVDTLSLMTTFVRIADSGSISSAARSLRLLVPMASRHLRSLEQELGVALVRRTTRRLDLTEAGAELLPRARRLLREVDETRDARHGMLRRRKEWS
jgi:DNA-binding transcriptional LysR family regulator